MIGWAVGLPSPSSSRFLASRLGGRSSWRGFQDGWCKGRSGFHGGVTRCRRHGVGDPIDAAFIQGSGDITPSQDHTPSLACEVVMESV